MELKTQALDRLLEALTPALTAELDRVVAETREALEQEFQKRLQSAVRDAENEVRSAAEAQSNRAVADAREATRKQVTEELEGEFKNRLAETMIEPRAAQYQTGSGTRSVTRKYCFCVSWTLPLAASTLVAMKWYPFNFS